MTAEAIAFVKYNLKGRPKKDIKIEKWFGFAFTSEVAYRLTSLRGPIKSNRFVANPVILSRKVTPVFSVLASSSES